MHDPLRGASGAGAVEPERRRRSGGGRRVGHVGPRAAEGSICVHTDRSVGVSVRLRSGKRIGKDDRIRDRRRTLRNRGEMRNEELGDNDDSGPSVGDDGHDVRRFEHRGQWNRDEPRSQRSEEPRNEARLVEGHHGDPITRVKAELLDGPLDSKDVVEHVRVGDRLAAKSKRGTCTVPVGNLSVDEPDGGVVAQGIFHYSTLSRRGRSRSRAGADGFPLRAGQPTRPSSRARAPAS